MKMRDAYVKMWCTNGDDDKVKLVENEEHLLKLSFRFGSSGVFVTLRSWFVDALLSFGWFEYPGESEKKELLGAGLWRLLEVGPEDWRWVGFRLACCCLLHMQTPWLRRWCFEEYTYKLWRIIDYPENNIFFKILHRVNIRRNPFDGLAA